MSRPRTAHPAQQLIAHARELSELCGRAIAISQALQALTGLEPSAERERLEHGGGAHALAQVQARVAAILQRAEVATRQAVGPASVTPSAQRRPRLARPFV